MQICVQNCVKLFDQAIEIDTSLPFITLASALSRCDPGIVTNHDVHFLKLNTQRHRPTGPFTRALWTRSASQSSIVTINRQMTPQKSRRRRGDALVEAVRKRAGRPVTAKEEVVGMVLPLASPAKKRTPAKRVAAVAGASGAGGKNKKAEADDGGATPAARLSKRNQAHPLKSIFAGLLSVYAMMRRRNKKITFLSVREGVEQASRRRFAIADLRSLARLVPDIVVLEEMRAGASIGEEDVVVRVNLPKSGTGVAMEAFIAASERQVLVESTPVTGSGAGKAAGVQTPDAKKRKFDPRIRSVLQSPTSRRLSDLVNGCERAEPGTLRRAASTPNSIRTPMAPIEDNTELYDRTISGIISMESLQQLDVNEQRHIALSSVEAKAARRERATIASLPDMLQRIMAVYGRKGPKVMAMSAVCDTLRGGGLEMVSREEMEARVRALAVHAGEFLKVEKGRGGVEEVWASVKGFDVSACMDRLKSLSR